MNRDIFKAIADPTRRDILCLIAAKSMTPNSIAEHFDSSRQAVSKHIRFLVECELLEQESWAGKFTTILTRPKCAVLKNRLDSSRNYWRNDLINWMTY